MKRLRISYLNNSFIYIIRKIFKEYNKYTRERNSIFEKLKSVIIIFVTTPPSLTP